MVSMIVLLTSPFTVFWGNCSIYASRGMQIVEPDDEMIVAWEQELEFVALPTQLSRRTDDTRYKE